MRDRFAVLLALVTIVCLGSVFFLAKGTQFLMPGPLASAHGAIENCSACHTKSGGGQLSWIHGLVAGDPLADSKACLTCHKMPDTAFNAHSVSDVVLKRSTERLTQVAAVTPAPHSVRAQDAAFPTDGVVARGLYCATCHQEHQGVNFDLSKISNEQCHSCHVVKFDSFDGHHPKFDNYPFKRRTRIIYDHAGHFGKHFPEFAKKDPERKIPNTCATCHTSRADKRLMAVAPFAETCTACHLDQILGNERVSGPKGIAFLTLPGLDLQTLREKNASIGEWPSDSEAELTPFMKVMISRTERGRALIETVNSLNLQELSGASDDQIKAVTDLAWETKGLFYALISGKASDVLGDLNIGGGAELSASLVADLTASLPRDVVISAHQEWLPNLATEMADRQARNEQDQSGWESSITETRLSGSVPPEDLAGSVRRGAPPTLDAQAAGGEAAGPGAVRLAQVNQQVQTKRTPGTIAEKTLRIDAYGDVSKGSDGEARTAPQPGVAAGTGEAAIASPGAGGAGETPAPGEQPANLSADERPPARAGDQTDDLLYPTEEELRAAGITDDGSAPPETGAVAATGYPAVSIGGAAEAAASGADPASEAAPSASGWETAAVEPRAAAPVISIQSDVDPESWAEYGGWYRQDYAIFYRPTGHKDKFIYSWLFLTGPQAPKGAKSPAAAVFDSLTAKDAQGICTKCHSVDDIRGGGRLVNFSPPKVEMKRGRFTNFIHEPHFGIMEDRGCLTCHGLEKSAPYLKSYEQGDPKTFVSNFSAVKKDLCQTCHTSSMARQDCLLCHKYHVDGVITPMMNTRIPNQ